MLSKIKSINIKINTMYSISDTPSHNCQRVYSLCIKQGKQPPTVYQVVRVDYIPIKGKSQ